MPSFRNDNPMCNWPEEDLPEEGIYDSMERGLTSEKHRVTHYPDGSSTHHWGGPCGSSNTDENGEEC